MVECDKCREKGIKPGICKCGGLMIEVQLAPEKPKPVKKIKKKK